MIKYKYQPPGFIAKFYGNTIWKSTSGKILITFDDGPNEKTTLRILELLNKVSVKSVFFCVGNNIEKFPGLSNEIVKSGHQIGNHTFNHSGLTGLNKNELKNELVHFNKISENILGFVPEYFRPPYGRIFPWHVKLLNGNGLTNVMWSLLPYDYKNDLNIVKFALNNYLQSNSIIVFHDSNKSAGIIIESINYLLELVDKKGFTIGTPSECLK